MNPTSRIFASSRAAGCPCSILGRELVVDDTALAERPAVDVDGTGDAVRPRVDRGVGDRAAAGVPDQDHLAAGRVK
jgi:hypothetical protein